MSQNILRYNAKVQKQLGSKTKPEPWLHCAWTDGKFVIYVWDTRKVVEEGVYKSTNSIDGTPANDNHKQLVGSKLTWFDKTGHLQRQFDANKPAAFEPTPGCKITGDDSIIEVFNSSGKRLYAGMFDYWNDKDSEQWYHSKWRSDKGYYELPGNYFVVCRDS